MAKQSILILAQKSASTNILISHCIKRYPVVGVIFEEPPNFWAFLRRRISKLGLIKVAGQLMFLLTVPLFLKLISKKRIEVIYKQYGFSHEKTFGFSSKKVSTINSMAAIAYIKELNPDLIVLSGTRILSAEVLRTYDGKILNIHAGITPFYRGVHGAYWALANFDKENCGVTVHLVDAGIDTGGILKQARIVHLPHDNYVTYPLLQLALGLRLLDEVISENSYKSEEPKGRGRLWYHPTLYQYLLNRIKYSIK